MINLKKLRENIEVFLAEKEGVDNPSDMSEWVTIKRKKKMIIEKTSNGNTRAVRRNYLSIEIIE